MNSPYAVIIPTRDAQKMLVCVGSILRRGCRGRLIVVDDDETGGVQEASRKLDLFAVVQGAKPFCYSRNVNLGIKAAGGVDCLLLNDDAILETKSGFDRLSIAARWYESMGIVSPVIRGFVGNPEQRETESKTENEYRTSGAGPFRPFVRPAKHHTLTFVCVYLRSEVIRRVGLLDERFTCYSHQDDDYCQRVRDLGYLLGVYDGCVVEHGITLKSSFRQNEDGTPKHQDLSVGREIFKKKHGFYPGERRA